MPDYDDDGPLEISLIGDLTDNESELTDKFLQAPPGGECVLYIDSPGGSPYAAMSLMSLILLRGVNATGVVTGECSSAALWPLAACTRRIVTPFSVLLFHPIKWQSEEQVGLSEAAEWARHFGELETDMDRLLAELLQIPLDRITSWTRPGRYVSGREFAEAGLAELVDLKALPALRSNGVAPRPSGRRRAAEPAVIPACGPNRPGTYHRCGAGRR